MPLAESIGRMKEELRGHGKKLCGVLRSVWPKECRLASHEGTFQLSEFGGEDARPVLSQRRFEQRRAIRSAVLKVELMRELMKHDVVAVGASG